MKFWMATAFAQADELPELVRAADRSGWHGITLSEHLFYPKHLRHAYPYSEDGAPPYQPETPWLEPWVTIGALSAVTERLHYTTNVYIAPQRDIFTVAKAVSTASVLSGGRVALGVGAGWSEEEFVATGQDFATRGKRLNEMIPALRELWSPGWREFHGEHIDFGPLTMEPTPGPIPIYVGGQTRAAFRRAAELGDGWIGTLYSPDDARTTLADLKAALERAGRSMDGFEVMLTLVAVPDVDLYREFEELGVTSMVWAPWMLVQADESRTLLEARIASIEQFGEEIAQPLAD